MSAPGLPAAAQPHWEGAAEGVLRTPHCQACGFLWYPPARHCPRCLSAQVDWQEVEAKGLITGWCVFHRAYFPNLPHLTPPYSVILVKLNAGPQLYSNLSDPAVTPVVGAAVEAVFVPVAPGQGLVRFRMVGDAA